MKVVIFTEGGPKKGIGHIARCVALYQAFLERGINPRFVVNTTDPPVQFLEKQVPPVQVTYTDWTRSASLKELLNESKDLAVVDSYVAELEVYEEIVKAVAVPVFIDDNNRLSYPEGIVVNGTIGAEHFDYPERQGITYLLGSQYIPIRKEFWAVPKKTIREYIQEVLVTFGGEDLRNLTPKVLKLLQNKYLSIHKKVIVGEHFSNKKALQNLEEAQTTFIFSPTGKEMKTSMLEADVAISAAGQTLYELARTGTPTITIGVADNQANNINNWQETDFIELAGWYEDNKLMGKVAKKLEQLMNKEQRTNKALLGQQYVDGKGAKRTVKEGLKKYWREHLKIRIANKEDMEAVYQLSNEQQVRANSFTPKKIPFESHKAWFKNKLEDEDTLLLIGEWDNKMVGQIRFNLQGDEAVISISVTKPFRNKCVGEVMINKAHNFLKNKNGYIQQVNALIKKDNRASMRFFQKAGYEYVKEKKVKNQAAVKYKLELTQKK